MTKPLIAVVLLIVAVPALFVLSRLVARQDLDDSRSVRDRAAEACAALDEASVGPAEVTAAVEAFEADKQLVLGIAARQAESKVQGGMSPPTAIGDLATDCRAVYGSAP